MQMRQGGFTLVEALVAVALLSIGFAGLYATVGAAVTALERSNQRGQLDYLAQMVLSDIVADISNIEQYQRLLNDQLQPLPLNLAAACTESSISCSNRNRWSEQLQTILGAAAEATLELHPICSTTLAGSCPVFGVETAARRSAALTVTVVLGRESFTARRVVDVTS